MKRIGYGWGHGIGGRAINPAAYTPASGWGSLKTALTANQGDVNYLLLGDSVSNDSTEWSRQRAQQIADAFPAYTTQFRQWGTTDYGAATELKAGSGANTFTWWNCALSGSTLSNFMGSLFDEAIEQPGPLTAGGICHGHNYVALTDASVLRGKFLGELEQIQLAHPGVPFDFILQNPRQSDTTLTTVVNMQKQLAAEKGLQFLDVHQHWLDAGKPAEWYADSIHPDADGQATFVELDQARFASAPLVDKMAELAWLESTGVNLLTNGDFSTWDGTNFTGWAKAGNGALTLETSDLPPGYTQAARLLNNGTNTITSLSQINVASAGIVGSPVTLWALVKIVQAANLNSGRFRFFDNAPGAPTIILNPGAVGLGGFRLLMISGETVKTGSTAIGPYLYANSSANTLGEIIIAKVGMHVGMLPFDF